MPYRAKRNDLADFQNLLIGRWENMDFGTDKDGHPVGGKKNPLSYNIMPLPQTSDPDGYILKNFTYYETLKFNDDDPDKALAIAATAPNRGGRVVQNPRALFYEQQVRFAEGPAKDDVVHVENGAWLSLSRFQQRVGPYPTTPEAPVPDSEEQPSDLTVAKQIAIPHGNTVLALGSFDTVSRPGGSGVCQRAPNIPGSPDIPDAPFPYPQPKRSPDDPSEPVVLNVDGRYPILRDAMADFQNPHPLFTQCPNKPLQLAVNIIGPNAFMHWHVTTLPSQYGRGHVVDIPFELRASDVTEYWADYWLLSQDGGKTYPYLAYTQTILMEMTVKEARFVFPHVTCNTVAKVGAAEKKPPRKKKK